VASSICNVLTSLLTVSTAPLREKTATSSISGCWLIAISAPRPKFPYPKIPTLIFSDILFLLKFNYYLYNTLLTMPLQLTESFHLSTATLMFCYNEGERFYWRDEFMRLAEKRVIALVDHDFEDLELWYPILRLQEEGALVHLIGPRAKE